MSRKKLVGAVLEFTASCVLRWPWWIITGFLALAVLSIAWATLKLELRADTNDLISTDLPYNRRYLKFLEDFGDLEFLYVVIAVDGDPQHAMQVADAIASELSGLKEYTQDVLHRIPPESFGDGVLLQFPKEKLKNLSQSVQRSRKMIQDFARVKSFAGYLNLIAQSVDPSVAEKNPEMAEWGFKFLDLSLTSTLAGARGEALPPLETTVKDLALSAARSPRERGYLFTENGRLAFVEIMPRKDYETLEVIRKPLERIREALERVKQRFPGVTMYLTGRPVLQADEMMTTRKDMTRATGMALTGVLALFILFFRRLRRPLLAVFALMVGITLAFGVATVTIGYLTLLSVVFAVMLVGLGIDFGIQFLARYQEELAASGSTSRSIRTTLCTTGPGICTCGLTTAAGFYSTLFAHFKGLAELGFVAGTGLILCLLTMMVFLPALILVTDRHTERRRGLRPPRLIHVGFLRSATAHPRAVVLLVSILTVLGLAGFKGVPYNWNLLELQAKGVESVKGELMIIERSDRSTWEAAFIVDRISCEGDSGRDRRCVDGIIEALRPAQERGIVGAVESVRNFVFVDQGEKIEALRPAATVVSSLEFSPPDPEVKREEMDPSLEMLLGKLDRLQSLVASRGSAEDEDALRAVDGLIRKLEGIQDLIREKPEETLRRLSAYQVRWFEEVQALFGRLERVLSPPPVTPETLPPEVRRRHVSSDGKRFLVHAYPLKDIWEEDKMKEFVRAIREVDPDVTGVPIQVFESARLMKDGFLLAALYSLIIVSGCILVHFRNLKFTALSLVPLAMGLVWTLELMSLLGLDFNLANFFALPILVGYGVTGGVQVLHRFGEFRSTQDVGGTVSSAVSLSFLTSIVGFGAMASAHHRGIVSLGMVTSLGCGSILLASLVFVPVLLKLVSRRSRAG